jgi:hypothetical protein
MTTEYQIEFAATLYDDFAERLPAFCAGVNATLGQYPLACNASGYPPSRVVRRGDIELFALRFDLAGPPALPMRQASTSLALTTGLRTAGFFQLAESSVAFATQMEDRSTEMIVAVVVICVCLTLLLGLFRMDCRVKH